MRKLAIVLPLALLASCNTFTWQGQGAGLSDDQLERGIKDIDQLTSEYETKTYWASIRRLRDGRINAFGQGLSEIQSTVDRHFFNYSATDPSVNYPTDENVLTHTGKFAFGLVAR